MSRLTERRTFAPLLDVAGMDDAELRYWARSITCLLWQHRSGGALADRGRLVAELTRLRAEHERRQALMPRQGHRVDGEPHRDVVA